MEWNDHSPSEEVAVLVQQICLKNQLRLKREQDVVLWVLGL